LAIGVSNRYMVGRQHARVNAAAAIASYFFQPMDITVVVLFGEKAGLAIDNALNDVHWNVSDVGNADGETIGLSG